MVSRFKIMQLLGKNESVSTFLRILCHCQTDPELYVPLCHPKGNSHTKFGIPSSINIGYMLKTLFFLEIRSLVKVTVT